MIKKLDSEIKKIANFLIDSTPISDIPVSDAIFVFGNIKSAIAEHAAKLFKNNKAPKIIIAGGIGTAKKDPNGFESEAEYFKSILLENDIPEESIIVENKSSNTLENVLFGMKEANNLGLHPKSLILVSIPPLLKRSKATFSKHFSEIKTFGSPPSLKQEWKEPERIDRLLGEIDRLDNYSKKGDISEVEIPDSIRQSYKYIRQNISESLK